MVGELLVGLMRRFKWWHVLIITVVLILIHCLRGHLLLLSSRLFALPDHLCRLRCPFPC